MIITLESLHKELQRAGGLSGREAASLLKLHQLHNAQGQRLSERQFRHWMSGKSRIIPDAIYRAVVNLADDLEAMPTDQWIELVEGTHNEQ